MELTTAVRVTLISLLINCIDFSSSMESNVIHGNDQQLHLTYAIFHNPPFDTFIRGPNGTYTYSGATKLLIDWLSKRYNHTYSFVPINQTLADEMGTHDALFYQLINDKDIDEISSGFYLTLDRIEKMDFTFFVLSEGFGLIVPVAGEESRLFAFVRPFQPLVWLLIFSSLIATICAMTYFGWFYYFNHPDPEASTNTREGNIDGSSENRLGGRVVIWNNFFNHMIYVINIMTNQGCRERFRRHSFRILAGLLLLAGRVLVNSYSGIVISSLTVPKMKPNINSLEDLAASKDVDVVLRSDISTGEQILAATSGIYKVIGDKARSKPGQILADPYKLNAKLVTGHYAYPFLHTFCKVFIAMQYKKDGRCRFKMTDLPSFSYGYYYFLVKKGSPYAYMFNKGYMDLFESGLSRFWIKQLTPRAGECFVNKKKASAKQVPIRLSDLVSAFLILGIGVGLAILSFLLELIYATFKKNIQRKKSGLIDEAVYHSSSITLDYCEQSWKI